MTDEATRRVEHHTPIPWEWCGNSIISVAKQPFENVEPDRQYDADVLCVEILTAEYGEYISHEINCSDASKEFIIRACNAHAYLVAALEDVVNSLEHEDYISNERLHEINAVLANAKAVK
jgi:hypothetical protein